MREGAAKVSIAKSRGISVLARRGTHRDGESSAKLFASGANLSDPIPTSRRKKTFDKRLDIPAKGALGQLAFPREPSALCPAPLKGSLPNFRGISNNLRVICDRRRFITADIWEVSRRVLEEWAVNFRRSILRRFLVEIHRLLKERLLSDFGHGRIGGNKFAELVIFNSLVCA